MLIKSINLKDYRNYSDYFINLDPKLNIITGNNGIGKTNILESIIVVSNTKSYRTNTDTDLIRKNQEYLKIELDTKENNFKVVINKKNKSLYIDNKLIHKTSEFIGKLNAILFEPSDLEIYNDSPSERRKLLDIEIGKISPRYLQALVKYNSLLKDKNKLLKEINIDEVLLKVINESMVPQIKIIIEEREKFFNEINKYISKIYSKLCGIESKVEIIYKKCSSIDEIEKCINESKEKDNFYHYTTYGPHHDDFGFKLNDYDLNSIASQGQKRMNLIAFKFALIKYIENNTGEVPVVLLDDIFSELDIDNQERLLKVIPSNAQVIITNTDISKISINKAFKLIELKED